MPSSPSDPTSQLSLPGIDLVSPFMTGGDPSASNTVELFDAFMVYSLVHERERSEPIVTTKTFRGRMFTVTVTPAFVKRATGTNAAVLPGNRENLIEKALRKIASEDLDHLAATFERDGTPEIWVVFTLYQLRKNLADQGHHFTIAQLEEGLRVLHGASLAVTGGVGADEVTGDEGHILQHIVWRRKNSGDADGRDYRIRAKLHPFITRSILSRTFRRIDYGRLMRPKNDLARWFYLRLSHNYTQAAVEDLFLYHSASEPREKRGYRLAMSTILREAALSFTSTKTALRAIRAALNELREHQILRDKDHLGGPFSGWIEETELGQSRGGRRPIADVLFYLFPSETVIDDIIRANRAARDLRPYSVVPAGAGGSKSPRR